METRVLPLSPMPDLGQGEIHVWYARPAKLAIPAFVAGVDRQDRLRNLRMQQQFLLRLLLGGYLGCPGRDVRLVRSETGKPRLQDDRGPSFSLSHAGQWLAIAIGRDLDPGIDIEPLGRGIRAEAMARRWFPMDEAEVVAAAADPGRAFLRRWTAREAMIKAAGSTIASSLSALQLDPSDPNRLIGVPPDWPSPERWSLRRPERPDALEVCLACVGTLSTTRVFHLLAGPLKSLDGANGSV
jgi:4'-phosphopantetheinyl transferase